MSKIKDATILNDPRKENASIPGVSGGCRLGASCFLILRAPKKAPGSGSRTLRRQPVGPESENVSARRALFFKCLI